MEFDYVVVGGGSAGCVVAGRLSEDPAARVCLIEAGPSSERKLAVRIPLGMALTMPGRYLSWAFETAPEPGLKGRRAFQPSGKTTGGSSAINGTVYIRGFASDYDHWERLGNAGWSYADVLPYFRKSEHNEAYDSELHGRGGPLNVTDPVSPSRATFDFLEAAYALGIPRAGDLNVPQPDGVSLYQTTTIRGERVSTARAFLSPARNRSNLAVMTDAHALRIIVEDRRAVGVEYLRSGTVETVRARREVIVSCGTNKSPQLLLLSGIGPAATLNRFGIGVVHDLPGVGENYQEHIDYCAPYKSRSTILMGLSVLGAYRMPWELIKYAFARRGMLAGLGGPAGVFVRSDPGIDVPDLQCFFVPGIVDDHMRRFHVGHGFTIHTHVCRPKSRGRVTLASTDPMADPSIEPRFFEAEEDLELLAKACRLMRRMIATEPLRRYLSGEYYRPESDDDQAIRTFLRARATCGLHMAGTCKMGHDPLAVVDDRLRVHGIEGLRVADGSIMPTVTSGNTNAPIIMIGEKVSDMIREDARG